MAHINFFRRFSSFISVAFILALQCCGNKSAPDTAALGLSDYFQDEFLIGVALSPRSLDKPQELELIEKHFNSLTAENEMKWQRIHPTLDSFHFATADRLMALATKNDMQVIGHALVWHSQLGKGVFYPADEIDDQTLVDSATLIHRIQDHITTVAGRYKGKILGWDVVNEALNDDGTLRESNFLKIIGSSYIQQAFEFANHTDPDAELYYNDYNMTKPEKRQGAIDLVRNLQRNSVRIDGIGMQAHWELEYPTLEEIEESIIAYASLGVKVMITELDISVLPSPWRMPSADVNTRFQNTEEMNPYTQGLPDSVSHALAKRYKDIFALFNKHSDKISRVTFWGLHDGISWKNGFPIRGRTDYPLLFDRELKPKVAYEAVIDGM